MNRISLRPTAALIAFCLMPLSLLALPQPAAGQSAPSQAPTMPAFLDKVALHNAAGAVPTEDGRGVWLHRTTGAVRGNLNDTAAPQMKEAVHTEIRFVLKDGANPREVKLSLDFTEPTQVAHFYGDYQYFLNDRRLRGERELDLKFHGIYRGMMDKLPRGRFANNVYRIVLDGGPVKLLGVEGDVRPPKQDELPPVMLAYGTSITKGARASRAVLTWPALTARRLGYDLVNLGVGGSAFCEKAIADDIGRRDWDMAVFELSVNMLGNKFSVEQFRERATYLINTAAQSHPDAPVFCISILPYHLDRRENFAQYDGLVGYRDAMRAVCESSPHDNVHYVHGPELMSFTGLTQDMIHPSDLGMIEIAEKLSARLRSLVPENKKKKAADSTSE